MPQTIIGFRKLDLGSLKQADPRLKEFESSLNEQLEAIHEIIKGKIPFDLTALKYDDSFLTTRMSALEEKIKEINQRPPVQFIDKKQFVDLSVNPQALLDKFFAIFGTRKFYFGLTKNLELKLKLAIMEMKDAKQSNHN